MYANYVNGKYILEDEFQGFLHYATMQVMLTLEMNSKGFAYTFNVFFVLPVYKLLMCVSAKKLTVWFWDSFAICLFKKWSIQYRED